MCGSSKGHDALPAQHNALMRLPPAAATMLLCWAAPEGNDALACPTECNDALASRRDALVGLHVRRVRMP